MHISVLLEESLEYLNIKENDIIVDCTLGYAGHSSRILKQLKKGQLYSFDQDKDAINYSDKLLKEISSNYEIIYSNFSNIKEELNKRNVNKVDGILYDLGVSSPQLDTKERGFSFHQDAKLDMRMDQNQSLSAYEVVNNYSKEQLFRILKEYGEEKYASKIVQNIINKRPIETTLQLAEIIKNSVPFSYSRLKHPARKTFQAIRIEVNDEINNFKKSIEEALELLNVGGRICVITFHSLEDKVCKEVFRKHTQVSAELKNMPIIPKEYQPKFKIVKVLEPKEEEVEENNRSRSAKLRVIERVSD